MQKVKFWIAIAMLAIGLGMAIACVVEHVIFKENACQMKYE